MLFVLYICGFFFSTQKKKMKCETCIAVEATPLILVCVTYIFMKYKDKIYTKASLGECLLELLRFKGLLKSFHLQGLYL